ncbi:unnamed protein product [Closterium sp. NIES-53]
MYLMTCTQPDLAYPLSLLARYVALGRHRKVHWDATQRVLRYLCSTSGMGLVLGGRGPVVLTSHSDASWVDDSATQRSSSCEAEIYAGAMAAQELRWFTYLLTDLGEQPHSPLVLYVDNKAMIALCSEHRLEHRTKHIALRYFLAQELQPCGQLRLVYVATRANTADVFTKALSRGDHQRFVTVLGLLALLCLTGLVTTCSPPLCLWGTCFTCPEVDLPHQPFVSHHNPSTPAYAPLEKVYNGILYTHESEQGAYNYVITFINAATRYVRHLNLPSRDMAYEAFVTWLPLLERELGVKLKSFQSDGGGEYQSQRFKKYLAERGIKRLIPLPYAHRQQCVAERMNRTLQNTMRKLLRGMRLPNHQWPEAMDHAVLLHILLSTNPTLHELDDSHNAHTERDLMGGFRGNRAFASPADEADWDEQNVDGASEEAGPLPYCSVPFLMDDENPRESINAEVYYDFADNGYVTPQPVNTNVSERIGPNFLPDLEAGDETVYPEDPNLPRYTQSGLQILGLVTATHGAPMPRDPATVQ